MAAESVYAKRSNLYISPSTQPLSRATSTTRGADPAHAIWTTSWITSAISSRCSESPEAPYFAARETRPRP
jgi:hypothetical protein